MSGHREVTYRLDFSTGPGRHETNTLPSHPREDEETDVAVPRIARLMALAIRFEALVRDETIQDYAELARRGRVTRARMTQIMKLLNLAPDIQEQILFLPAVKGINERNLRPLAGQIDWHIQRCMFQQIRNPCRSHDAADDLLVPDC